MVERFFKIPEAGVLHQDSKGKWKPEYLQSGNAPKSTKALGSFGFFLYTITVSTRPNKF